MFDLKINPDIIRPRLQPFVLSDLMDVVGLAGGLTIQLVDNPDNPGTRLATATVIDDALGTSTSTVSKSFPDDAAANLALYRRRERLKARRDNFQIELLSVQAEINQLDNVLGAYEPPVEEI